MRHWMLKNIVTLKSTLGSLKIIGNGTIRKLGYGFLFASHSNYRRIFSRLDTLTDRQTPHDSDDTNSNSSSLDRLQSRGKKGKYIKGKGKGSGFI